MSFGCCSRFKECSDKGHCVNPYDELKNNCYYKTNLDAGLNFYSTKGKFTFEKREVIVGSKKIQYEQICLL